MVLNVAAVLLLAIHMAVTYFVLPSLVAVKFDIQNLPCEWMSKDLLYGLFAGLVLVLNGVFVLIGRAILRASGDNMHPPYQEYWLAVPERLALLKHTFVWHVCFLALIINSTILISFHLTYTNTAGEPFHCLTPNMMIVAICGSVCYAAVSMFVSLRPPKSHGAGSSTRRTF